MKKSLLFIAAFLLILAGCSSDDVDVNNDNQGVLGYWEYEGITTDYGGGYHFKANGKIASWEIGLGHKYSENDWGLWWTENGKIQIKHGSSKIPDPDEMYYAIVSLTESQMVIRSFGGFAGTPYEKGVDHVFKKLPGKPSL